MRAVWLESVKTVLATETDQFMTNSENRRVFISYFAMEKPHCKVTETFVFCKVHCTQSVLPGFPCFSTASDKHWVEKAWVRDYITMACNFIRVSTVLSLHVPNEQGLNFISDLQTLVIISSLNLAKSTR